MEYRKKVTVLSCIIAALALIYVGAIVFDPARRGAREDVYTWMNPRDTYRISGITIALPPDHAGDAEAVVLTRAGRQWFVLRDGRNYPARPTRVDDFIAELTRRAPFPVRATSAAAHERLLLTEGDAARVTVASGMGLPLLDLLLGQNDLSGRNVYMRRAGQGEVRSGEDRFSAYVWAERSSWYDLALFRESDDSHGISDVMRLIVYPPATEDGYPPSPPMVFTRIGRNWEVNFDIEAVNAIRVDTYIRDILMSTGEDFANIHDVAGAAFDDSRIVLEFHNGSTTTIGFTPPDPNNRRLASVSGTDFIYVVSAWMHQRLFPRAETFGL